VRLLHLTPPYAFLRWVSGEWIGFSSATMPKGNSGISGRGIIEKGFEYQGSRITQIPD